jgi:hypothetical protein
MDHAMTAQGKRCWDISLCEGQNSKDCSAKCVRDILVFGLIDYPDRRSLSGILNTACKI